MIVTEGPQQYRLITQNDHGDLAGQFAAHWGNDKFARLDPYASMVLAVEAHDNGWWHWDINPSVDEEGVLWRLPGPRERNDRAFTAKVSTTLSRKTFTRG